MDNQSKTPDIPELPEMKIAAVAVTYRELAEEEWEREEDAMDSVDADADEDDDSSESSGAFIRYNRAFIAKMSLAEDRLKAYYNVLKNALLSYRGVKSRLSWCFDSFNCGRHQLAKINVRGGGLIVYLALDSAAYAGTKYRYRDVGYKKKFVDVPMQIKVKSKRGLRYALELTADVMGRFGIAEGKPQAVAYAPQRESLEMLMRRNLVRVVNQGAGASPEGATPEECSVVSPIEEIAADATPLVEEIAAVSQPVAEVTPTLVDAAFAEQAMSDAVARDAVTVERVARRKGDKKAVVNVDVISRHFAAGDVVTLDALIRKHLVSPRCGFLKVCARGALDKPLTVKANDFSLIAVKMIVLTGGKAVRVKGD